MEVEAKGKNIGTHSGQFHCDECVACTLLINFTEEFKGASVTRTRDLEVLDKMDIVVDVGGVYDPKRHRYDHHQKEFQDTWSPKHNIRLSSAGLVFRHFGREIIKKAYKKILEGVSLSNKEFSITDENDWEMLYQRFYDKFFLGVDGNDNGVDEYQKGAVQNYKNSSSIFHRVARLNPAWFEQGVSADQRFQEAMKICLDEFLEQLKGLTLGWFPARPITKEALLSRFDVHPSGRIIKFVTFCQWKDHLLELEKELNIEGSVLFVLFPDGSNGWRVQAAPQSHVGFELRKPLKKELCGVTNLETLRSLSGIEDIVFCHANGFIGGAKSFESSLKMAVMSLE